MTGAEAVRHREQELEGDADPRETPVRVPAVEPVRVHERSRGGQVGTGRVVVGHDDVDPGRARLFDRAVCDGPAVAGQDERGARRLGSYNFV